MSGLTVIMVSWRRRQNCEAILKSLSAQTVRPQIMIWSNDDGGEGFPGADHVVRSGGNFRTWPRWLLASLANTEFVLVLDDDLLPFTADFVETCLAVARHYPDRIIGVGGRQISQEAPHYRVLPQRDFFRDRPCEVVLGRLMLLRRSLLARVPLVVPHWTWRERGDDIIISTAIRRQHVLSGALRARVRELPTGEESLSADPQHFAARELLVKRILDEGFGAWKKA
ncbi:MAG: glycosyltransferase family A protein [Pseudomonadota bacterium]